MEITRSIKLDELEDKLEEVLNAIYKIELKKQKLNKKLEAIKMLIIREKDFLNGNILFEEVFKEFEKELTTQDINHLRDEADVKKLNYLQLKRRILEII